MHGKLPGWVASLTFVSLVHHIEVLNGTERLCCLSQNLFIPQLMIFGLTSLSRACCQNVYKILTAGFPFRDNTWGMCLERAHTQTLLHCYSTSKSHLISLAREWKRSKEHEAPFCKESLDCLSLGEMTQDHK